MKRCIKNLWGIQQASGDVWLKTSTGKQRWASRFSCLPMWDPVCRMSWMKDWKSTVRISSHILLSSTACHYTEELSIGSSCNWILISALCAAVLKGPCGLEFWLAERYHWHELLQGWQDQHELQLFGPSREEGRWWQSMLLLGREWLWRGPQNDLLASSARGF